jgi:ketosteroid isomerase-like protein
MEAANRGDVAALSALMSPDVEIVPMRAALESDTAYRGPDAAAQWLAALEQSWERLTAEIEDVRVTEDCVLALGRIRGRGRQSGVGIDVPAAALARFRAGQLTYLRVYTDQEAALEAAGLSE